MNKLTNKIFLLGVGAQKGGTTWLWSQLCKSRNVDMGFVKEYHVFDNLNHKGDRSFIPTLQKRIKQRIKSGDFQAKKNQYASKHLSFLDNPRNYFDYFNYLYLRDDDVQLVGDITPSYSLLDKKTFSYIKEELEKKGFKVKVIFLLREPFDRVWSMLKMACRNGKITVEDSSELNNELKKFYKLPHVEKRTRYEITIKKLEAVFDKDSIYIDFYERLFTEESFSRIQHFLETELVKPDFNERVNVSKTEHKLFKETQKEIIEYYSETYKYIEDRFGDVATSLWEGYDIL